ncbi:hypothetical protein H9W95_10220 [Flavobacterium lindanitolerans]|nr:hypothetical protein [Flavobacterium lindanitolerans]
MTAANIQSNQKLTTVSNGTNTTVASTVTGNTTDYKVSVPTATASNLGVVKEASSNPTIKINSNGELSVNLSGTGTPTDPGVGKNFSSTDLDITNGNGATLTTVTANIKDGAVTSAKILDGTIVNADIANSTITTGKIANAGNNQVLTTNASGTPVWTDQSVLIPVIKNTTVSSGTYTTLVTTTPIANTTNYQVDVSPTALAGAGLKLNTVTGKIDVDINTIPNASDKTATVAAGTNTSITTNNANPNNPIYTVNVPTANGTALGVVKEAAVTNPTIKINSNGELSVNLSGTGTPTDLVQVRTLHLQTWILLMVVVLP